jgi:hypothetical protein
MIRRKNMALTRRESQAVATDALDGVIHKVRRARARDDETITLWLSEAETLVHEVEASRRPRPVGAPKVLVEFQRWMARDVYWWRDGGAKVRVANSEVAKGWEVSIAMVEETVRKYGADARGWLKRHGDDRESTAVLIAQWAEMYRMLAIKRNREEESPTQRARRDAEGASGGRMRPARLQ